MSKKDYSHLIGQKFGRLHITELTKDRSGRTKAKCLCDCGKETVTQLQYLLTGHTKSCGCYREERGKEIGAKSLKHGLVGHPLYSVHQSMKARCENPTHKAYKNYGGRGITVCEEWHSLEVFVDGR